MTKKGSPGPSGPEEVVLLLGALAFVLYILFPLLDVIVAGAVLAYVVRPMDEWFRRHVRVPWVAALITTLVVAGPFVILAGYGIYSLVVDIGALMDDMATSGAGEAVLRRFMPAAAVAGLRPLLSGSSAALRAQAEALPLFTLEMGIMFITMYYYLISYRAVEDYLGMITPRAYRPLVARLWGPVRGVLRGMLYGHLLASLLLGVLGGIAYAILGIRYAALLGLLTAICSLLPVVGPYAVFTPLVAVEFFAGSPLKALALLSFGVIVLTAWSNFYLYPKIGGKLAGTHGLLVLVAYIGGPLALGVVGLVYGALACGLALGVAACAAHRDEDAPYSPGAPAMEATGGAGPGPGAAGAR